MSQQPTSRPMRVVQIVVMLALVLAATLATQLARTGAVEAHQTQSVQLSSTPTQASVALVTPTAITPAATIAAATLTLEPFTATAPPPKPSATHPARPTETASATAPTSQPTKLPATARPRATRALPTPTPTSSPAGLPMLTMGASNTTARGYRWGPVNLATHDGFDPGTMLDTAWTPPECWPDAQKPANPPRTLTIAQCAIYYFRPRIVVLFLNRPFNGQAYYDEVAEVIDHIQSYEDELGLTRSAKIVMGPVTYEGGVIGSAQTVIALGARVVDVADIVAKTKSATGFDPVTDNVHLAPSPYFWGVLNIAVQKAMGGGGGTYTVTPAEIPTYTP